MAYEQDRNDPLNPRRDTRGDTRHAGDESLVQHPSEPGKSVRFATPETGAASTAPRTTGDIHYERRPSYESDTTGSYGGRLRDVENARDDSGSAAAQHEVDRTRARMDDTIDTLAQRLRPSSLLGDVLDWFATDDGRRMSSDNSEKAKRAARRAGSTAWEKVRNNPVPSALIGAGIAYLFLKGDEDEVTRKRIMRHSREPRMYGGSYVDARTGEPYDLDEYGNPVSRHEGEGFGERMKEYAHEAGDAARSAAGAMRRGISRAAGAVSETASDAASRAGDAASRARSSMASRASSAGSATTHGMSHAGDWAASRGRSAWRGSARRGRQGYAYSRDRFEDGIEEHPLAMGMAALAAGMLAGLAVPRTRSEDRMYGEYAHRLKDQGKDLAHEAWERGRHVAEAGADAARREAENRGMTRDSLRDRARDLAEQAKEATSSIGHAAKDAAREAKDSAKAVAREAGHAAKDEAKAQKDEAKAEHTSST